MNKRSFDILFYLLLTLGIGTLCANCAKSKINSLLSPTGAEVASNSSVRVFNFYNYNLDVTINNIPLTNYGQASAQGTQAGLSIFPSGSWLTMDDGNPFFVPNSLVAKDRKVHILISTPTLTLNSTYSGVSFSLASIDTTVIDDPLNPNDYYALSTGHLLVVPRSTAAPSQPQNFKIRIINLGAPTDPSNLVGPVSMDYSDGSAVDPALSNVGPGQTSAYVELPYGAFMFKLFSNGDFSKQLTELPLLSNFNSCSFPQPQIQEALFPKIRTFKPGATYSVVITQNIGIFQACNYATIPVPYPFNAYRIVTEQSPGLNTTYARMDAFNALPVVPVSIMVDGQPLGGQLPYTGHTDYGIYVQGTHHVQVLNAAGTVLATQSVTLSPYDNYTAWVYQNPSGQPDICFANTDMTSTLYQTDPNGNVFTAQGGYPPKTPPVDDGTNGSIRVASTQYAWQTRFLNLTPDVPYVTFTNNGSLFTSGGNPNVGYGDSVSYADASINLSPGATALTEPFVIYQYQCTFNSSGTPNVGFVQNPQLSLPSYIRVFQSQPGPPYVVPGTLMGSVTPLTGASYISNPAMYTAPQYSPQSEPGIYTTALIGRYYNSTSEQDAPRLVILKHNK
jgi:hypothetical protein